MFFFNKAVDQQNYLPWINVIVDGWRRCSRFSVRNLNGISGDIRPQFTFLLGRLKNSFYVRLWKWTLRHFLSVTWKIAISLSSRQKEKKEARKCSRFTQCGFVWRKYTVKIFRSRNWNKKIVLYIQYKIFGFTDPRSFVFPIFEL